MAYVDPENITPAPGQGQMQSQAPQTTATGGAGLGNTGPKANTTPGNNTPQQPSAQLSAYLNANKPQSEQFAGNIAGTLSNQVGAAQGAINPAVNAYTGSLYTVPTDTAINTQVSTAPSQLNDAQKQAFQKQLTAAQNSPSSANTFETTQPYQDVTQKIQGAVEQANLWNQGNSVGSLKTALQPFESQNATGGAKTLDALLLSQVPTAYNQIRSAVAPAAGLQGQLSAETQKANKALQDAIATNQATTNAAKQTGSKYVENLNASLQNTIAQQKIAQQLQNQAILSMLQGQKTVGAPKELLQPLGLTNEQWQSLTLGASPVDTLNPAAKAAAPKLADYLTQIDPNSSGLYTPQSAVTQQQISDIAVLKQLLGQDAPTNIPITEMTPGVAPAGSNFNQYNTGAAFGAIQNYLQAMKNIGYGTPPVYTPAPTPTNPAPTPVIGIKPLPAGGF